MAENKFLTRETWKPVTFDEKWKKLPNFQLVRPLTIEQEIERFTTAGRKLDELRGLGVYDFDESQPIDDTLEDPTREEDFDMIDAAVAQRDALLRMQSASSQPVETKEEVKSKNENKENTSDEVKEPVDEKADK